MKITRKNVFAFLITILVILLAGYFSNVYVSPVKAQSTGDKNLTGYAWSDNIGWISFATSTNGNNQVTIDSSGNISGYAWSDNIGWIKFGGLSNFPSGPGTQSQNANINGNNFKGWARAWSVASDDVPGGWIEQTNAGQHAWYSIASSADGTKLVAVVFNDYIYTSTDSGVTWIQRTSAGQQSWRSIISSSDGTRLAALDVFGRVYISVDSGITWTKSEIALGGGMAPGGGSGPLSFAGKMTSSSDGTNLVFPMGLSYEASTNSGATWKTVTAPGSSMLIELGLSSDGGRLVAISPMGSIFTSTDGGVSWTQRTGAGSHAWTSVTSSSDGTKLAVVSSDGYIFTSTDGGVSWTQRTGAGSHAWTSVTSSSDGTKLAVVSSDSYSFISNSSGATWTALTYVPGRQFTSVKSSSDGSKLASVAYGGYIYTYEQKNSGGWDGWISLSGDGYGVAKDVSNSLSGYAWGSDVVGWINFGIDNGLGGVSIVDANTNGACGSSNLGTFSSAPSGSGLCSIVDQASSVANPPEYTTYTWSCLGTNGVSDMCHAQRTCGTDKIPSYKDGSCVNSVATTASDCSDGYTFLNGQCVDSRTTCTLDGVTLENGATKTFYKSSISSDCGAGEVKTCTAGTLSPADSVFVHKKCVSPKFKEF